MLCSIYISNFLLIKKVELTIEKNFSVITGNTGAGKSIILNSILFCLGSKLNTDVEISDSCSISLVFSHIDELAVKLLEDSGIEFSLDSQLIIRRTQYSKGRSRIFVNDQLVTLKLVKELFQHLIEFHGQHNNALLRDPLTHTNLLDKYAGLTSIKANVSRAYIKWKNLSQKLIDIQSQKEDIENEIDYLNHICQELDNAKIIEGEEERLSDLKRECRNKEKEIEVIQKIIGDIDSSNIEAILNKSQKSIMNFSDNMSQRIYPRLESAYDVISDLQDALHALKQEVICDDYNIEDVDDRLNQIKLLARKHSIQSDELPSFLKSSQKKLNDLKDNICTIDDLKKQIKASEEEYLKQACYLSECRIKGARPLEEYVANELKSLHMNNASFKIEINTNKERFTKSGIDNIRFIASTNAGMECAPINNIASGGELSRFMLALRVALLDSDCRSKTIIFDEIDTGLGGVVADAIGKRLSMLGKTVQTIAVTHQPQVASWSDDHILIEKQQIEKDTIVTAKHLTQEEKILELARMISGRKITPNAIKAAQELISYSR